MADPPGASPRGGTPFLIKVRLHPRFVVPLTSIAVAGYRTGHGLRGGARAFSGARRHRAHHRHPAWISSACRRILMPDNKLSGRHCCNSHCQCADPIHGSDCGLIARRRECMLFFPVRRVKLFNVILDAVYHAPTQQTLKQHPPRPSTRQAPHGLRFEKRSKQARHC